MFEHFHGCKTYANQIAMLIDGQGVYAGPKEKPLISQGHVPSPAPTRSPSARLVVNVIYRENENLCSRSKLHFGLA